MKYYLPQLLFILVFGNTQLRAIENDNLTLLEQLTREAVQQAFASANAPLNKVIIKKIDSDGDSWFVEKIIIKTLKDLNCDSIIVLQKAPAAGTVCEFKIINLGVNYHREGNFWRTTSVNRNLKVELWFKIYNSQSGVIFWAGGIKKEFADKIKMNHITRLQNPNIKFTQGVIPPLSNFRRFVEPGVVIGLTGVIIYLFYSFRSK